MIDSSVARRYARALLSLGLDEGRFEQYGEELESVVQAMKQSPELGFLLVNPGYTQQQRQGVGDIEQIARVYRALVDQQAGRIRATVTSAGPLSDQDLDRLREAIGRMTGRSIVLESKTDSSLIGGVVAQVGPTMLDGSLRTQLERMRQELKSAPG